MHKTLKPNHEKRVMHSTLTTKQQCQNTNMKHIIVGNIQTKFEKDGTHFE